MSDVVSLPLPWLVADIGGTNMRLGRVSAHPGPIRDTERVATPRSGDLVPAIAAYLDRIGEPRPRAAALAVAGPVVERRVQLTNSAAHLDAETAEQRLGLRIRLFNDLEAVAAAVPRLERSDVEPLTACPSTPPEAGCVVLGCGTGCGVAASVRVSDGWHVVASEAGHLPFAPVGARDMRWLERVGAELPAEARGRVTYDRVLCGSGLLALAETIAGEYGVPAPASPEHVVAAARSGTDSAAVAAAEHFSGRVGAFAGDLAQAFAAHGGVYLAGSLLEDLKPFLQRDAVAAVFAAKWPHDEWLARIPLVLITAPQVALTGLAELLARR